MSRKYDDAIDHIPDQLQWMDEYWQDGVGYSRIFNHPHYFVTTTGDVISLVKERPRILRVWHNTHGHEYVHLCERYHKSKYLVHRLVAEAFIPNPENYPIVRHLDDNPSNNNVENLAWGTQADNVQDMIRNGGNFEVLTPIYCFENGKTYKSGREAAKDLNAHPSSITLCCQGLIGHVKGKHLCYEDEIDIRKNDPDWFRPRDQKPIIAIYPDGSEQYFGSRQEAAEYLGIPDCGISSVVRGNLKHTHGYRFREAEYDPDYQRVSDL